MGGYRPKPMQESINYLNLQLERSNLLQLKSSLINLGIESHHVKHWEVTLKEANLSAQVFPSL